MTRLWHISFICVFLPFRTTLRQQVRFPYVLMPRHHLAYPFQRIHASECLKS